MGAAAVIKLERDADVSMAAEDNLAFMRPLANESMDLIVTSPPYNIGKVYEERSRLDSYVEQQAQVISECVRRLASTVNRACSRGGRTLR